MKSVKKNMKKQINITKKIIYILFFMVVLFFCCLFFWKQNSKKKQQKIAKTLWSHIVYTEFNESEQRKTTLSHGLFNQLYSLFHAVDVAEILDRHLVIGKFYVSYTDTHTSVPLSKIINLASLGVYTTDMADRPYLTPQVSDIGQHAYDPPSNTLEILLKEHQIPHLEIGCLFNLSLPDHTIHKHIQAIRFHPIFYNITSTFQSQYPQYQVIHYRMEGDFASYFHQRCGFGSPHDFQQYLFREYKDAIQKRFDPDIPIVVVSHYYKDPGQARDFDLPFKNIIHTKKLQEENLALLYEHLGLPKTTPIREVEAVLDFVISTSPNVRGFIGIEKSTFSEAIVAYWANTHIQCHLIKPEK